MPIQVNVIAMASQTRSVRSTRRAVGVCWAVPVGTQSAVRPRTKSNSATAWQKPMRICTRTTSGVHRPSVTLGISADQMNTVPISGT